MPLPTRGKGKPSSLALLAILLAVPVILLVALLLLLGGWIPGASILLAWDCIRDGHCDVSVMFTTRITSSKFVGPSAYSMAALCAALAYIVAWIAVTRTLCFFWPARSAAASQVMLHGATLGYVAADTLLVWWLARLLWSSS